MLAATKNSLITILVEGDDAQETMEKLIGGFENHFGEQ
jgi:phosphocarrier protein